MRSLPPTHIVSPELARYLDGFSAQELTDDDWYDGDDHGDDAGEQEMEGMSPEQQTNPTDSFANLEWGIPTILRHLFADELIHGTRAAEEIAKKIPEEERHVSMVFCDEPTKPGAICEDAARLVSGDRRGDYGDAVINCQKTAELWTAYLNERLKPEHPITATDVPLMMILFKIARHLTGRVKRDNFVDMAGYADVAHYVASAK